MVKNAHSRKFRPRYQQSFALILSRVFHTTPVFDFYIVAVRELLTAGGEGYQMNKYLLTVTFFIVAGFFADVNGQANAVQTTPSALTSDPTALVSLPKESEKPRTTPEASAAARKIYKMGVKYGRARLFRQAAESFEKAVQLDPDFADAHFGLGHAYFDLGRWQESIQSLEQGLKLNPKDAQAYTMLGEA